MHTGSQSESNQIQFVAPVKNDFSNKMQVMIRSLKTQITTFQQLKIKCDELAVRLYASQLTGA